MPKLLPFNYRSVVHSLMKVKFCLHQNYTGGVSVDYCHLVLDRFSSTKKIA